MQENISLKPYNTFGVDVQSKYFAEVCSLEELIETLKFSNSIKLPLLFLGGGSNILLTKDFEGLAIQLNLKGFYEWHCAINMDDRHQYMCQG